MQIKNPRGFVGLYRKGGCRCAFALSAAQATMTSRPVIVIRARDESNPTTTGMISVLKNCRET